MAGCHSKLSDKRFQNWIKASYAGNIAKEGVAGIVVNKLEKFQKDILSEVITEEKLEDDACCSVCKTENILKCPTRDVCKVRDGVCSYHNCKENEYRKCPNRICDRLRVKIRDSHRFNNPSLRNTFADLWCTHPLEIAKCYLPLKGYFGVKDISEMDWNGVLNVMFNLLAFEEIVDHNVCYTVKTQGTKFRHSPGLLISDFELRQYLNDLVTLLTSSDVMKNDSQASEAVRKIHRLKAETLTISNQDVTELLLKCILETKQCSDTLRDIVEQSKQSMEEALEEIRASKDLEIKEITEAATKGTKNKLKTAHSDEKGGKSSSTGMRKVRATATVTQHNPDLFIPSTSGCMTEEQYNVRKDKLKEDLLELNRVRHSTIPFSPLLEKIDASLLDFYVIPNMFSVELKKFAFSGSEIKFPVESLQDLFRKERSPCREIYLSADAGLGKTAFCKYITLAWCYAHAHGNTNLPQGSLSCDDITYMKNFDFVFLISLRESRDICDIDEMLLNLIVKGMSRSSMYTLEFLQEILHREKCLVILDSLDEWTHPENPSCQITPKCVPHRKARGQCTILTTSRPWKLCTISVNKSQIHHLVKMVGLSAKSREDLKRRAISKVKANGNDAPEGNITCFEEEIRTNEIGQLETIPMVLMYLVCLWCEGKPLGRSKCELFTNIIELKLVRNKQRLEKLDLTKHAKKQRTAKEDILKCFSSKPYCKLYFDFLKALGELAFSALFNVRKESTVMFDRSVAEDFLSEEQLNFSFFSGILTQTEVPGYLTSEKANVSFSHKTFQEFFAALHTATTSDGSAMLQTVLSACTSIEEILELSNTFIFLSGISPARAEVISRSLADVVARDDVTCKYRRTESFWDYYSVEEQLKYIQDMQVSCMKEYKMNFDGSLNLHLEDFMIDKDCRLQKYVTALEALAVANDTNIKSLNIELEGIHSLPEIIDMFGLHRVQGLEHLLLRGECTEQDIIRLVSKSTSNLKSMAVISRIWRHDHFEGHLSSWSHDLCQTLQNMNKLEAIHLNGFSVCHGWLEDIVGFLTQRATMKEIILGNICCADHPCGCSGFELDMSKHSCLRTLRLHNLPLSRLRVNVSSLEQASVGKLKPDVLTSYLGCLPSAKKLEKFRCSFLDSARDVEEVLKTFPALYHLKDLRLHDINLGRRDLTLSQGMTDIEFIHLSEVIMSSSATQALVKRLIEYEHSVLVVLVDCNLGTEQDEEMIKKSIKMNSKFVVLFDGENQWGNYEFSFRTMDAYREELNT